MQTTRNERESEAPDLRTEIKAVSELTGELANLIRSSNDREFGNDSLVYDVPEWYVLGFLEGALAVHVGILCRTITVDQVPLQIGGICYLVTEPENRGRGLAYAVMDKAVDFVKNQLQLPFCLLTCKPRLEALYTKWGWQTVAGPTIFLQAGGLRHCGGLTMIFQCGGKPWPAGKIDLCGLPW
jgi:GNAT superfamily N-acetyltransferase